ncbi:MAG: imidazolonepropionase [bacterium]
MKYSLVIENISSIFTADKLNPVVTGDSLAVASDREGKICFVGSKEEFLKIDPSFRENALKVVDAKGKTLYPGLVDSHTHLVFAATREEEFAMKARGATYEEIAAAGGGILNSVKKTAAVSLEEIVAQSAKRLEQVILYGVTTVEIKSGYGLDFENELKLLKAIDILKKTYPVEIVATFLGAHAYPEKFKNDHEGYINLIINEMLPEIKKENLAEFVDVFCEEGYFSLKETEKILVAAKEMGFGLKLHADEFNSLGGTELAAEIGAASVDHLEEITDYGIEKLANSDTVAGVLPITSIFSRLPFAPAKKMVERGVTVALATDLNPGSCMCGFLPLAASVGATQLRMSVEDSLLGITLNGAKSLKREQTKGSISIGKDADFVIMDSPSWIYPVYHFAHNHVYKVFVKGEEFDLSQKIS